MSKVKGPLLSLSAKGQLGKALVFASWRGVPYARQHVVPSNPRTTAQTLTRNVFTSLDDKWKRLGPLARAPWDASSKGRPFTGRNNVMAVNIPLVRDQADMALFQGSPGVGGGLAPVALAVVPGASAGELDVTVSVPQAPVDWDVTRVVAIAFPDHDPAVLSTAFVVEDSDDAAAADADSEITLAGLTADTLHVISAWIEWTRSDGETAYGTSLTDTETSTA